MRVWTNKYYVWRDTGEIVPKKELKAFYVELKETIQEKYIINGVLNITNFYIYERKEREQQLSINF